MNTFLAILFFTILFTMEAVHDYNVIQGESKKWHRASVQMHLTQVCLLILFCCVGASYIHLLVFYPIMRGLIFWPLLNKMLNRDVFHLSDHFMERWFKNGATLYWVYLALFAGAVTLSIFI